MRLILSHMTSIAQADDPTTSSQAVEVGDDVAIVQKGDSVLECPVWQDIQNFATFFSLVTTNKKERSYVLFLY